MIILSLFVCVGVFAGCGEKKQEAKTIECTLDQELSTYQIKATYKIHAKGDTVEKVEVTETSTAKEAEILDQLERTLKLQYDNLNNSYGGYTYNVTKGENQISTSVTIDYSKFDSKKFADDRTGLNEYMKDGKLTVAGVQRIYEMNGATCK